MAVKTARINTVSFSYSNVAKNGLVVKTGDILTLVDGADGQKYVDLATPESLIWGICDSKGVFPEENETKEKLRVNYTPIAWDNTYKMEVAGEGTPKVGMFYTMTADQKIDLSTESDSVGQFMVQDIYDSYIEVRFVCNQGLFVPQYQDVRLESIREKNPDSEPFDGLYIFTLSNGTEIEGDFSALAWYLGDVTITGKLTVNEDLKVKGDSEIDGDSTVTGDESVGGNITSTNITASGDIRGNTIESDTSIRATTAEIEGELTSGNATVLNLSAKDINAEGNAEIQGNGTINGGLSVGESIQAKSINSSTTITATGDISGADIRGANMILSGNQTVGGDQTIQGASTHVGSARYQEDVDIDGDLNVDGSSHIGGSSIVDGTQTVNDQLVLGPNATAPQFILQSEKNEANGVAALNASGKLDNSVLPPLAIGETFVVSSEAQMLALTAQTGDRAIRTDISKTFVKLNDNTPSVLGDWQVLLTSGEVISVNGQTGAVELDADDISDVETTHKFVTEADKTNWNAKQDAIGYTPENQAYKDTVTLVNDPDHYPSSSVVNTLLSQKQNVIGYTPENVANKDTAQLIDSTSHYPSSHVMYDQLATKQQKLESGQNIKTINNQSLLGSGNIDISVGINFYYETVTQGASSHTLGHTPISPSSIIVFTDSGTVLFPTTDYTCVNNVVTFNNLGATESAIIWILSNE